MYKTTWSRLDLVIIPLVKVFIRDVLCVFYDVAPSPAGVMQTSFERRVGDYQKASVMSSLDGGKNYVFKIDEEF
ncbi:hypothetical protein AAG906_002140 [Vitis piasezkii]